MKPFSALLLSNLRGSAPLSSLNLASFADPGLPPLWYENGVIWALPFTGANYPVAFCSINDFADALEGEIYQVGSASPNISDFGTISGAGFVDPSKYAPPFSAADAPAVCFSYDGGTVFFIVMACTPSAMPFALKILTGLGIETPAACAIYPGLGRTCVVPSTDGNTTVDIQYVLVTGSSSDPIDFTFRASVHLAP